MLLMRMIDEQYTRTPFYGVRKMTAYLRQTLSEEEISRRRVRRLMREMGLQAIFPGPKTSHPAPGHRIYPYLLRGVKIERRNQVWSSDITYIRLAGGFIFLSAVIDWHSRYVLSWAVSNTLQSSFCLEALAAALEQGTPEIFNTDQGSQFTSTGYTGQVLAAGSEVSMDGRGRALDNVFVERLWRSVKYEDVYLKEYPSVLAATAGLRSYFEFYNQVRPHQALQYQTPAQVYSGDN